MGTLQIPVHVSIPNKSFKRYEKRMAPPEGAAINYILKWGLFSPYIVFTFKPFFYQVRSN
jgi:hypothetical protein